ncbi:MAG: energy-coupling factor transporter ATPase [Oscillospiraceae bacterium]|jgi:energy-coupling factor transporter ATPase
MEGIRLENVTYAYAEGEAPTIDGLDLEIKRGEFVCVIGPNGSGKSTLSMLLNGLIVPTSGTVTVDGYSTADDAGADEVRRRVGHVFQDPDNQIVSSIVEEDVAFGPENLGVPPGEIEKRVAKALSDVGLSEKRRDTSYNLSGGQKQRLAIAGILAMEPRYLVLDEPTAMLDPQGRSSVMKVILEQHGKGMTVVLITHHMDEAAEADRVVLLADGKKAADGTPRKILGNEALLAEYGLDQPYPAKLAAALIRRGISVKEDPMTIEELESGILEVLADGSRD